MEKSPEAAEALLQEATRTLTKKALQKQASARNSSVAFFQVYIS